jgi:hypothetical protein
MLLLVIKWLVSWLAYILIFMAVGFVIGCVWTEIEYRYIKSSGLEGLGAWVMPVMTFWAFCIIALIVVIVMNFSFSGILNTIVTFLPGCYMGTATSFTAMPFWSYLRKFT